MAAAELEVEAAAEDEPVTAPAVEEPDEVEYE